MRNFWYSVFLALMLPGFLLLSLSSLPQTQASSPSSLAQNEDEDAEGDGSRLSEMTWDGRTRTYKVFLPSSYRKNRAMPMVMVFHGGGGNADSVERMSNMSYYAEKYGFIVVYPNGTGPLPKRLLTWSAGNCCGYALGKVDDVGFVHALIAKLKKDYAIDPRRIYATGISNGGMLSYLLACTLSNDFAAIAPVAGALNVENCQPKRPVAVIAFHGTADQHVLYQGGVPKKQVDPNPRTDRSVLDSVGFWVKKNRCNPKPRHQVVSGNATLDAYENCFLGADVHLYTIQGGTHSWPGGRRGYVGGDTPDPNLNASELMLQFFLSHPGT